MCALKTFNLDEEVYKEFSEYCKKNGISMSKRVENFIREEMGKINESNLKSFKTELSKELKKDHPMNRYC